MEALQIAPEKLGLMQNSLFTITLESFSIEETRSTENDTDYVTVSVAVGSNPPQTLPTKSMGNLGRGTYPVNLSIPDIEVLPNEAVAFVYSIVNTGYDQDTVEQKLSSALTAAATQAAAAGGKALGGAIAGPVGSFILSEIGSLSGAWLGKELAGFILPDCDGPVAGATHTYSGEQLAQQTAGGRVHYLVDINKGTDSKDLCGGNSQYSVKCSISGRPKPLAIVSAENLAQRSTVQEHV
jgi:hypothetical protein